MNRIFKNKLLAISVFTTTVSMIFSSCGFISPLFKKKTKEYSYVDTINNRTIKVKQYLYLSFSKYLIGRCGNVKYYNDKGRLVCKRNLKTTNATYGFGISSLHFDKIRYYSQKGKDSLIVYRGYHRQHGWLHTIIDKKVYFNEKGKKDSVLIEEYDDHGYDEKCFFRLIYK